MSRARDLANGTFSGAFAADSPTLVVDAANNRVGMGTASPNGKLAIASTGNTGSSLEAYSATDSIIPDFQLLKSGSGTIGTLSTTANGEALGQIRFTGIDTANNQRDGAKISVYQNSAATSGTVPAGIRFDTTGSERVRIDNDGLKFNGDTAAANALDDYEWGTFTPSVGGATSDPSQTYQSQAGYYVKIGNLVHVNGWIDFAAGVTAGSGNMQLKGFPFTVINNIPASRGAVHLAEMADFSTANQGAPMFGFLENNGTLAWLEVYPNHTGKTGSMVNANAADIQSRSRFSFNCTYVTA